jgi:hypothetical protein
MMRIDRNIVIDSSVEEDFALLSDPVNNPH